MKDSSYNFIDIALYSANRLHGWENTTFAGPAALPSSLLHPTV